jgi:hypothetical protein
MVKFTPEQKTRLGELLIALTFSGETSSNKWGGQAYTPWDFINTCTPNTLEQSYNAAKRTRAAAEKDDPWAATNTDAERVEQLKRWEEFLFLAWGYSRWKLDETTRNAKKERLAAQLDRLVQENKTPAERIAELKAELEAV